MFKLAAFFSRNLAEIRSLMLNLIQIHWSRDFAKSGEEVYHAAHDEVKTLMAARPDDYLEFSVLEGWEPLCKFLGKPVPQTAFPRDNDAAAIAEALNRMLRMHLQPAATTAFVVAMISVVGYWAWQTL